MKILYRLSPLFLGVNTLLAATTPPAAPGSSSPAFLEIIKFLPFLGLFYYFMIYQPKKKSKEHQEALNKLRKGDKIVTSGGLLGTIHKIDETSTEASIEIGDNVIVKILKNAITPLKNNETSVVQLAESTKQKAKKKS